MIMSHDSRELLKECLSRIKATTDIPYEVVIVDDASNPPYTKDEFDATIIHLPKRSNCCTLRNIGMEMSRTEYVFWLDNDTMVEKGWYKPLIDKMDSDPKIGLVGQPKDSRLIRNPFLPLTQEDCMTEYEFAYDYNHLTGECDFITSYCILVRKSAFRPTHCYHMPTPVLDPDLGACIKVNGYKVVVSDSDIPVNHLGSSTGRPNGRNYLYYLSRHFTEWFRFWEPHASKIFELYRGIPVQYDHDANEPARSLSKGQHGDLDKDFEVIPDQYKYIEP